MGIGERIKKRRRELDISQEKLAELVDVHENTIRKWEQGTRSPDAQKLNLLASALGTTVGVLMGEVEPEQSEPKNNLPINNAQPESESYLDLGYWGNVADNARKVARSDDPRRSLVMALLNSAMNEFLGNEAAPIMPDKSIIGVNGNIQGDKNNVKVGTL